MPHWGGTGDYLCLQELEELDTRFDREDEDRANRRAARSIGINGSFEDWTWENWMLIEVERGLPASCYSCLMFDSTIEPYSPDIRPDPDDPRILLGFLEDRFAINHISQEIFGQVPPTNYGFPDDYLLRAETYLRLGPATNAPELLAGMANTLFEFHQPGSGYYTYSDVADIILERGGYMPTSEGMAPSDQELIALYTFSILGKTTIPEIWDMQYSRFITALDEWRMTGYQGSLVDHLNETWDP